jgi:hypothetical protein
VPGVSDAERAIPSISIEAARAYAPGRSETGRSRQRPGSSECVMNSLSEGRRISHIFVIPCLSFAGAWSRFMCG